MPENPPEGIVGQKRPAFRGLVGTAVFVKKLDLAISPCPNDTFIFYHLTRPGFGGLDLTVDFADVEELNRRAVVEQRHAFTKLSFYAMALIQESYELLPVGAALGRGCGPLLITKETRLDASTLQTEMSAATGQRPVVLVPGAYTTANFLAQSYLKDLGLDPASIEFVPTRYDRIMPELQAGRARYGVLIHEERFTYQKLGLHSIRDLGDYWEEKTGLPIPLGCIAVRRDVPARVKEQFTTAVRESLTAMRHDARPGRGFIKEHAQALEDQVIQAHIDLYVNDYSLDLGPPNGEARRAISALFAEAQAGDRAAGR